MEKNFHVDDLVHFIDNCPSGAVQFRGIKQTDSQTVGILESLKLKKKTKPKPKIKKKKKREKRRRKLSSTMGIQL